MTAASASSAPDELVGVLPAAGLARRSAPLPCSKEIFPVGLHQLTAEAAAGGPKPACGYLLESMRLAGGRRAIVALRPGKWDIPAYLGSGAAYGLALAYTVVPNSPGVPWTVQNALSFVPETRVLFGFPDVVFRPPHALARVERRQRERGADVTLGLFLARRPEKVDMVDVRPDGLVRDIVIKPETTDLRYTWLLAVWTPAFSAYLEAYVQHLDEGGSTGGAEVYLGDVVRAALASGWRVDALEIPEGSYCDIGTPDELGLALDEFG